LYIEILLNEVSIDEKWTVALTVKKISKESDMKLAVIYEGSNYPIDILFEDLSWNGTSCYWKNFDFNNFDFDNEVIIINTLEEFQNYFTCTNDIYPEVDFSTHTLILARGLSFYGISKVTKSIQQLSPCKSKLDIELWKDLSPTITWWGFTLVINKINEGEQVELNVVIY
jgi:hypothetical protein